MEPSTYHIRRTGFPHDAPIETEAAPVFPDEGESLIDIRAYWRTVRKRIGLIAAITLAALIATAVHVEDETPTYTAETTILIEPNASMSGENTTLANLVEIEEAAANADQYYKTQCAILQSRKLAISVIRKLDLQNNPIFSPRSAGAGLFASLWPHLHHAAAGTTVSLRAGAGNQGQGLTPDTRADSAGDIPLPLVHQYLDGLKVTPVQDTNLVKIAFSTPDPALSARLANAHVLAYGQQQVELRGEQSEQAKSFLQKKLVDIKDHLEKSEAALNKYRGDKGIIPGLVSLDGKDAVVLDRLTDLSKELTQAQVARIGLEAEVQPLKAGKRDYDSLPAVISSPSIQALNAELNRLYTEQAALASQFKPDYPPLAKLDAKIHEVQSRQASEVNKVVGGLPSPVPAIA